MKKIEDYLPFYYGQRVLKFSKNAPATQLAISGMIERVTKECVLSLRPLSDMTPEEMIEIIQISVPDSIDGKPTTEDYDLDLFYNDGGNMVDDDVVIGANYSCICYVGQIAIRKCGTIHFFDEDGERENFYNMPKVYLFLLSKHFDLFGLIESGLAIDAKRIK